MRELSVAEFLEAVIAILEKNAGPMTADAIAEKLAREAGGPVVVNRVKIGAREAFQMLARLQKEQRVIVEGRGKYATAWLL